MAVTPAPGYIQDPSNPNGVISIASYMATQPQVQTATVPTAKSATPTPTPPPQPPPPQPEPTPKPVTALSSDQGAQYASQNSQTLQTLKNTGLTVGADGLARYSDSSFASAPSDAVQNPETGTWSSGGVNYAIGPATAQDPEHQAILDQISTMKTQFDSTSRAMIQNIQDQFSKLIQQQTDANARGEASLGQSLLMAGSSRYAPISSTGQTTSMVSYGLSQIADLQTKEQTAVINAQQAMDAGDMKFMDESLAEAQKARESKQKAAQTLSDSLVKANQDLQKQKTAAALSKSIADLMAGGTTDPAKILQSLHDAGNTTATADDVGKAIKALTPDSSSTDTFKFSQSQASQLYASGLTPADIKVLQDYYNGKGDPSVISNLTPEHHQALMDALNGTASKIAASQVPSYAQLHPKTPAAKTTTYKSGSLTYSGSDLKQGHDTLYQSSQTGPNADGRYANPELYLQMATAWQQGGGSMNDFLKNYPISTWINPENTQVIPAVNAMVRQDASAVKTTKPTDAIANPFQ